MTVANHIPRTTIEVDPDRKYKREDLREMADAMLRENANRELCRVCKEEAKERGDKEATPYGFETGHVVKQAQFDDDDEPMLDDEGNQLYTHHPEYECERGHRWYQGEGMLRSTRGADQILFDDHLAMRHKREIYVKAGIPDPHTSHGKSRNGRTTSMEPGLFNRVYPEGGRKINDKEQREKHGAGFYRG